MNDIVVKVQDLEKNYGERQVLKKVSLSIKKGETKVITGPSGHGKSTLLKCINLLEKPDAGKIWLGNKEITSPKIDINRIRMRIGFVFQEHNLFHHLTVMDNVLIGLVKVKKMKKEEALDKARQTLETVYVDKELWSKYPAQISGGEKQRVAIARALAMEPEIILYDEPTTGLDPRLIDEVLNVMKELSRKGVTSLVVTHEIDFALEVADEIMFMYDGKIIERGKPEKIVFNPDNPIAREFFARTKRLYGGEK